MKTFLGAGVNNYPGTGSDLSGCVNDVLAWQAAFAAPTSLTLIDDEATKENIMTNIKSNLALLGAGDTGMICFSGHGSWVPDVDGDEPDGRDECLCPFDVKKKCHS